ncbi:hypothetical protein ID866_3976 [Astraeus odoratus]|nr:hypothetical protein ID866_3976 [Astraeus odoratus]
MHRVARSVLTRKSWQASLSILGISLGLSLFSVAYKRALDPLFGSIPTEKYLDRVVHTCTVLGVLFPKPTIGQTLLYLATLVQFASHSTYWVSVFAARYGDPIAGPLAPHTLVLAPIVFLSVSLMMRINVSLATLVANILRLRWAMTTIPQKVFLVMRSDHVFLLLGTLTFAIWTLVNGNAKPTSGMQDGGKILRRLKAYSPLFIPATFLLFPVLRSPVLSANSMFPYHSDKYPLRILSSEESLTGRIVVGELLDVPQDGTSDALHSLRYLRASHSLLGGVWTADRVATIGNAPPQTDGFGTPIGDSIYSAFVLQEAVRLVNSTPQCRDDHCGNALVMWVIGVGAGIVADALARHGVSTTLIEIDPAVYTAARKYFGLKHPGDDKVFLEDARGWLRGYSGNQLAFPTSKFDIVVHDCFSGGGLPKHLFSIEFWDELKTVMTPNGVVAIVRLCILGYSTLLKRICRTELRWRTWVKVVTSCGNYFARSIWTMQSFS